MGMSSALDALRSPRWLRRLALASVAANVVIVVTGGAVRLTDSGLGCPTWPSCTDGSLTPTKAYSFHGVIEFTNRQLTFLLAVVVVATLVSALLSGLQRRLAVLLAASIPAQAVLGGITVLTHLNPWAVASHFLLSMGIIAVAFTLWWRVRTDAAPPPAGLDLAAPKASSTPLERVRSAALRRCAGGLAALTVAVLAAGTVVTGSGPHAGSSNAHGEIVSHRIQLTPRSATQLHADLVMVLIGMTVAFVLLARAAGADSELRRSSVVLLVVELSQGVIGFAQYFLGVPAVLVAFHMFGACLVWLAALRMVVVSADRAPAAEPIPQLAWEDSPSMAR